MKRLLNVLILALFCLPGAAVAQKKSIGETVDQYLSARAELGRFSGGVLVAKGDEVILQKGYGFANVEKKIPFTSSTKFLGASLTKMFTAMAALKLRDRGKLSLTDPICKYVTDCPAAWQPITLEELLRHRSGIPDYEEALDFGSAKYFAFMTQPDPAGRIIAEAKLKPLDFKPNEQFNYSNTGYILLARVVEEVSGQSYSEFLNQKILRPAKMSDSGIFSLKDPPKNLALGYTYGDLAWDKFLTGVSFTDGHLSRVPLLNLSPFQGDGGLFFSTGDLFRWSRVMDGRTDLVSQKLAAEVFSSPVGNYGYGWFVTKQFGETKYWHTGLLPGFVSDLAKFPDHDLTILVVTNMERTRTEIVARDVAAIALGQPFDMPVKGATIKLTAEQIVALEGEYRSADGQSLTVKNDPNYLTGAMKDASGKLKFMAGWIPISPTEFYFPMADGRVTFVLDATGKAVKANLRYGGSDHLVERVGSPVN